MTPHQSSRLGTFRSLHHPVMAATEDRSKLGSGRHTLTSKACLPQRGCWGAHPGKVSHLLRRKLGDMSQNSANPFGHGRQALLSSFPFLVSNNTFCINSDLHASIEMADNPSCCCAANYVRERIKISSEKLKSMSASAHDG